MLSFPLLDERKKECKKRLLLLEQRILSISVLKKIKNLCIYVTGSYGRFEANKYSDLDLFILKNGSSKNPVSKIDKIILDSELINITREMGFKEFSNDGQYLEVQYTKDMLENLGSAEDDYKNYFTARQLLLLESYPLFNKNLYDNIIEKIINSYFRDYHDHDKQFRPIFLVNDIMRYYKTMCLNYEHKRNRRTNDITKKNKAHLKNLKLKFSRLLTCYSSIITLIQKKEVVTPSKLFKIVHKTPIEKLLMSSKRKPGLIKEILERYIWFLKLNDKPEEEILKWIGKKSNRDESFNKGREFHKKMYDLLTLIADESDLMYLTI